MKLTCTLVVFLSVLSYPSSTLFAQSDSLEWKDSILKLAKNELDYLAKPVLNTRLFVLDSNEIKLDGRFVPLTFGSTFATYSLIYLKKNDKPHYYIDIAWGAHISNRKFGNYKFNSSDEITFVLKNDNTIYFTEFVKTYNNSITNTFYSLEKGTHTTTYHLFHAVIEVSKSQLDEFVLNKAFRVTAITDPKTLKQKINTKMFAQNISDFYSLIETKNALPK